MSLSDLLRVNGAFAPISETETVAGALASGQDFLAAPKGLILRQDLLGVSPDHHTDPAHHYSRYHPAELAKYTQHRESVHCQGQQVPSLAALSSPSLKEIIQFFHQVGHDRHYEVYLIGGFVRDLARQQDSEDLDFIVVGSPTEYAQELIAAAQGSGDAIRIETLRNHPQFGTMTLSVTLPDGFHLKVDLATARTELYASPAELPVVQPAGSIQEDIFRRDFTVNTMALQVAPELDHFLDINDGLYDTGPHPRTRAHGLWELEPVPDSADEKTCLPHRGFVRCLHPLSFVDDPTRIFRALRFAVRFNYLIAYDTSRAIHLAVRYAAVGALSGGRRTHEFQMTCATEAAVEVFQAIVDAPEHLGGSLLPVLLPGFRTVNMDFLRAVKTRSVHFPALEWKVFLLALGAELPEREFKGAVQQAFKLPDGTVKELILSRSFAAKFQGLALATLSRFEVFCALEKIHELGLCYLQCHPRLSGEQQTALENFATDLHFKLQVDGNQLIGMGIPKGKQIFTAKRALMKECINCEDMSLRNSLPFQLAAAEALLPAGPG